MNITKTNTGMSEDQSHKTCDLTFVSSVVRVVLSMDSNIIKYHYQTERNSRL